MEDIGRRSRRAPPFDERALRRTAGDVGHPILSQRTPATDGYSRKLGFCAYISSFGGFSLGVLLLPVHACVSST